MMQRVQQNGTLFAHTYLTINNAPLSKSHPHYNPTHVVHTKQSEWLSEWLSNDYAL